MKKIDYQKYVGKQFGRLRVAKICNVNGVVYFYCLCECGTVKLFNARNVLRGRSQSCGCLRKANLKTKRSKLSDEDKRAVIKLRASGLSYAKIAIRYNVSRSAIHYYCMQNVDVINKLAGEMLSGEIEN